jgi:hypothetical protein
MTDEAASGRVFISYRRGDTSATAGRLYDRLVARFGTDSVFTPTRSGDGRQMSRSAAG